MNNELARIEPGGALGVQLPRLDVAAIKSRVAEIERLIDGLMIQGVHYGPPFPGTDKLSLLQPGAELMVEAFGLVPRPRVTEIDCEGEHKRFLVEGGLETPGGHVVGWMRAECSTLEPKYRYRKQGRVCPTCGIEAIMASRYPDKETGKKGWYCNRKADGCGAQFPPEDPQIIEQEAGRVENPDPAELYHTCAAMAQKRWLVAIVRRTFALSARFIDAEAERSAPFNWDRAAPLLRALPGERREKWGRVVVECLRQFGKPPEQLTALEGSIVVEGLARSVPRVPLVPSDFMESPEASSNGEATAKAEPDPELDPEADATLDPDTAKAIESKLSERGLLDAFAEEHGPPSEWTEETRSAAKKALKGAKP